MAKKNNIQNTDPISNYILVAIGLIIGIGGIAAGLLTNSAWPFAFMGIGAGFVIPSLYTISLKKKAKAAELAKKNKKNRLSGNGK